MIKILGTKRILMLVMLIAIDAALGAGVYAYVAPEKVKQERALRTLKGANNTMQSDISRLQIEFDQLEQQQAQFDELKEKGFMSVQSRRQAARLFERIGNEAGVVKSVASVRAGKVEDNAEAEKAEHKILRSSILVEIKALDDIDVFRYIYLVEKSFPGHIVIDDIIIERKAKVGGAVLRSIATGDNPELVKANISMVWRTMIPKSAIIDGEGGGL